MCNNCNRSNRCGCNMQQGCGCSRWNQCSNWSRCGNSCMQNYDDEAMYEAQRIARETEMRRCRENRCARQFCECMHRNECY